MRKKTILQSVIIGYTFLGVMITLLFPRSTRPFPTEAEVTTIYDFDSQTDIDSLVDVALAPNLVFQDSLIESTQNFTINVGAFDYVDHLQDVLLVGGNNYTTLTGTNPGQFVYGSPTLQSLATLSNLVTNKRLYGIRYNADFDLTYYENIVVTFGWDAGGTSEAVSGFIATSVNGSNESWSLLSEPKHVMSLSTAGTFSGTDPKIDGQLARFALIFGIGKSLAAMHNFTFTIQGTLRTSLNTLSDLYFDRVGNYIVNESIARSDLKFTANYLYRMGGNAVSLNAAISGVTLYDDTDPLNPTLISSDPFVFATAGTKTIRVVYVDPDGFGSALASIVFNIDATLRTMTGIEVTEQNPLTYYYYEFYHPQLRVYPLYNGATIHDPNDLPLNASVYTIDRAAGELLTADFTLSVNYLTFSDTLTYTVLTRTFSQLILNNVKELFIFEETFSLGNLVVTAKWSAGPDTIVPYSVTASSGSYYSTTPVGYVFAACGQYTNTIKYVIESVEHPIDYIYSVEYQASSFFQYYLTDLVSVWGATTTTQYGNINQSTTLNNVVYKSTDIAHNLITYSPTPSGDQGAYVMTTDGLTFGQNGTGPATVQIKSDAVAQATVDKTFYMSVSKLRIDCATDAVSTIAVSVAGILTTEYEIDGGERTAGSLVNTIGDGLMHTYIVYMPYVVIGPVSYLITNSATPEPMTISFFAYAGYNLTEECQAKAFAQMLNHSDSCNSFSYTNFLATYTFLSAEARTYLLTLLVPLQDQKMGIEEPVLTAQAFWDILVSRYSGVNPSPPVASAVTSPIGFFEVSLLILVVGIFLIKKYRFIE